MMNAEILQKKNNNDREIKLNVKLIYSVCKQNDYLFLNR